MTPRAIATGEAGEPSRHDARMQRRGRRLNLTPVPLQFASLSYADAALARVRARAETVEGLQPKTLRWMKDATRSLLRFLGDDRKREQTFLSGNAERQIEVIEDWIAWMRARGLSRTTIATYWHGLASVFRRLERASGMFNPLACMVPPKAAAPLPRCLTREAAEALLHRVRNYPWASDFEKLRNLALVGLMQLAGLRKGEALRLTLSDVDPEHGTITIVRGKGKYGGKDRTAYMTPQLAVLLSAYMDARRRAGKTHPELLSSVAGNRRIGEVTIRRLFKLVSRELGMRITPHMLRHTYATLLRQSGVPDRVAQDLLGHNSLTMLQRYSHVFDGEHAAEAARLRLDF